MSQKVLIMLLLGPDIVSNQFTAFVKGIADLVLIPEALKFEDLGKEDEEYAGIYLSIV